MVKIKSIESYKTEYSEVTTLKVDVNDRVEKIVKMLAVENKSGYLVSNGKILL